MDPPRDVPNTASYDTDPQHPVDIFHCSTISIKDEMRNVSLSLISNRTITVTGEESHRTCKE